MTGHITADTSTASTYGSAMLASPSRIPSPADEWFGVATGHAAHAVCGALLFALGAVGIGLQGCRAVKRLRGGRRECEQPLPPAGGVMPRRCGAREKGGRISAHPWEQEGLIGRATFEAISPGGGGREVSGDAKSFPSKVLT